MGFCLVQGLGEGIAREGAVLPPEKKLGVVVGPLEILGWGVGSGGDCSVNFQLVSPCPPQKVEGEEGAVKQ